MHQTITGIEHPNVITLSGEVIYLHSVQPRHAPAQIYGVSFSIEEMLFLYT